MAPPADDDRGVRRGPWLLGCLAVAVAAFTLHAPTLGWTLVGDDFEYARRGHEAAFRPAALVEPVGDLPRPLVTASFVADWWLWPRSARGAHLTTLGLHVGAALLLVAAARRLGLSAPFAGAVGLLWACSPFAADGASWASARADSMVLAGWLGCVLAWPATGRTWTGGAAAAAVAGLAVSALAKETWVGAVVLVAALEGTRSGWRSRATVLWTGSVAAVAAGYAVLRLGLAPAPEGYLQWSGAAGKLPRLLAAFLGLEVLAPVAVAPGWRGAVAALVAGLGLVLAWRVRARAALIGAALLVAGAAPVLAVAYLPIRYAALPYAGFLLAAAALAARVLAGLSPRGRCAGGIALGSLAALLLAAHLVEVRRDQVDGERIAAAHRGLVCEARGVAGDLPMGLPVAVLRAEADNPLAAIAASPVGRWRLLHVRQADPYGLVEAGALLDWAREDRDVLVETVTARPDRWLGAAGPVLVHRQGGFVWAGRAEPDLSSVVTQWRERGGRLQVVVAEALP